MVYPGVYSGAWSWWTMHHVHIPGYPRHLRGALPAGIHTGASTLPLSSPFRRLRGRLPASETGGPRPMAADLQKGQKWCFWAPESPETGSREQERPALGSRPRGPSGRAGSREPASWASLRVLGGPRRPLGRPLLTLPGGRAGPRGPASSEEGHPGPGREGTRTPGSRLPRAGFSPRASRERPDTPGRARAPGPGLERRRAHPRHPRGRAPWPSLPRGCLSLRAKRGGPWAHGPRTLRLAKGLGGRPWAYGPGTSDRIRPRYPSRARTRARAPCSAASLHAKRPPRRPCA